MTLTKLCIVVSLLVANGDAPKDPHQVPPGNTKGE